MEYIKHKCCDCDIEEWCEQKEIYQQYQGFADAIKKLIEEVEENNVIECGFYMYCKKYRVY